MSDIKSLEYPTLKVPYEILNKKFRAAQKTLDREVSHISATSAEVEKYLITDTTSLDITNLLGGVVDKLTVMKRKAEEAISEELEVAKVCKKRLEHLKEAENPVPTLISAWRRKRLDRMLVEHFLRSGYYNTAMRLAKQSEIENLTNIDVFLIAREVEESLNSHETAECLSWCHDNRSRLRKLHSTLEFNLRVQEFIEFIKNDRRMDAVKHARKHFVGLESDQWIDVQHCMALLAYPLDTIISPYRELLSEDRWKKLIAQFRSENYKLFQLSFQSVFAVALQAGLSALKTPHCYRADLAQNSDCPVCQQPFNSLAEALPHAHCSQSRLICHVSGQPMNENNHPLMLPNGCVYGLQALTKMGKENNGSITCPRNKEVFNMTELEKVYVM